MMPLLSQLVALCLNSKKLDPLGQFPPHHSFSLVVSLLFTRQETAIRQNLS